MLGALTVAFLCFACAALLRALRREQRLREQLSEESNHDPLTGLPNRRYFAEWLSCAIAHARRQGTHVGVLFIDVNGCAAVGELHGEHTADAMLIEIARRFRAVSRRRRPVRTPRDDRIRARDAERAGRASTRAARAAVARPVERRRAAASCRYADRRIDRHRVLSRGRGRFGRRDGSGQRRDVCGAARRQESRRVQRAGGVVCWRRDRIAGQPRSEADRPPRARVRHAPPPFDDIRLEAVDRVGRGAAQPRELALRELARGGDAALAQRARGRYARRDTRTPAGNRRSASTASARRSA